MSWGGWVRHTGARAPKRGGGGVRSHGHGEQGSRTAAAPPPPLRAITAALNKGGKVPMFSNVGTFARPTTQTDFWLDEARLLDALDGLDFQLNYEFMRAEGLASTGQTLALGGPGHTLLLLQATEPTTFPARRIRRPGGT